MKILSSLIDIDQFVLRTRFISKTEGSFVHITLIINNKVFTTIKIKKDTFKNLFEKMSNINDDIKG